MCFATRCSQMCWDMWKWEQASGLVGIQVSGFLRNSVGLGVSAVTSCHHRLGGSPFLVISKFSFQDHFPLTSTYFEHTGRRLLRAPHTVLGSEYLLLAPQISPHFLLAAWRGAEYYPGGFVECFELLRWKAQSSNFVDSITPAVSGPHVRWQQGKTHWNQRSRQLSREGHLGALCATLVAVGGWSCKEDKEWMLPEGTPTNRRQVGG